MEALENVDSLAGYKRDVLIAIIFRKMYFDFTKFYFLENVNSILSTRENCVLESTNFRPRIFRW